MKRAKISNIERPKEGWLKTTILAIFSTGVIVGGLVGFSGKIYKFLEAWWGEYESRFALIPVAAYFMVAFGFTCVFVWAAMNGMLTDIEAPKYRMLDNERELDEAENREGADPWA